jgi:hypothetical protein
MTDELQQSSTEHQQENTPVSSDVISSLPQKSNKNLWVIVGIAIAVLCCCSIICIVAIGLGVVGGSKVAAEKAPIESVLDSYMKYMAAKDFESAYALFSPRAQRQFPISKIKELLDGNNYMVFEGYQSLSVNNLNISAAANTNPNIPQGTVAKVTGTVTYEGGIQGTFNGTLEKVNEKWQIDGIFVNVPPSKFKP